MYRLKNWSVISAGLYSRYIHPDYLPISLAGEVYGHSRFADGKRVTTSKIGKIDGRQIMTYSGSVYILDGPPDNEYMEFLQNNNIQYDEENPIKIVNRYEQKPGKTTPES